MMKNEIFERIIKTGIEIPNEIAILSTAIVFAGAMAGGD